MNNTHGTIAYFSMAIGLEVDMPTYSGGLGVLAGDTIRSAADLKIPLVAATLLHRKGYFYQRIDSAGWQAKSPMWAWMWMSVPSGLRGVRQPIKGQISY